MLTRRHKQVIFAVIDVAYIFLGLSRWTYTVYWLAFSLHSFNSISRRSLLGGKLINDEKQFYVNSKVVVIIQFHLLQFNVVWNIVETKKIGKSKAKMCAQKL